MVQMEKTDPEEVTSLMWVTPSPPGFSQIRYISQTQGLPAEYLLSAGTKTSRFFNRGPDSSYPLWKLKVGDWTETQTCIFMVHAITLSCFPADTCRARGRDGHQVEGG